MSHSQQRLQTLYEISLAIGRGSGVEATAREALSAYCRKLDCAAGGVFERQTDGYDAVTTVPKRPTTDAYRAAREWLAGRDPDTLKQTLPRTVSVGDTTRALVFALPSFGVLMLIEKGRQISPELCEALRTLNRKLADACRSERVERRLREQRNRFEAVMETMPAPMVDLVITDEPIVRSANSAFVETFDCDPETLVGKPLDDVFDEGTRHDWTNTDEPVKCEQERVTTAGRRTFSLRTAPVETTGDHREQFGVYLDVTEERRRAQTLERLYRAAQEFLEADSARAACERAIEAATELLDYTACGVHLYDRGSGALVPFVTRRTAEVLDGEPEPYTDQNSFVWETYRSGDPVLVRDTATFDGRPPDGETSARSGLVLPLGDHGVLIASAQTPGTFTESDLEFGQLLAAMLRTALDRAKRERTLRAVQQTTQTLVTAADVQSACDLLVERVAESFGFPYAGVWRIDRVNTCLRPIAISDPGAELFDDVPTFEPGNSIAWSVFESGEARVVDEIADNPDAYDQDSVFSSEVIVPMNDFGVLAAGSMLDRDVSQIEFDALQTLVTSAESAIQTIEQRAELDVLDQVLARVLRHNIRNDLTVIRGRAELLAARGGSVGGRRDDSASRGGSGGDGTASGAASDGSVGGGRDDGASRGSSGRDGTAGGAAGGSLTGDEATDDAEGSGSTDDGAGSDGFVQTHANIILNKCDELLTTAANAKQIRDVVDRRDDRQTVDLADIVASAAETVADAFPAATIQFDPTVRPEVSVHPEFEYAVQHAIENGVEHHPDDAPTVHVQLDETDTGTRLSISDDGPGIPSVELEPIRRQTETDLRHGSGVGLWIIDRIVEYSDGIVRFETDSSGTTVVIEL